MKPVIVKKGWATVKIYTCPVREKYTTYFVCWYVGRQRMRRGLSSLEAAKREAKAIAESLSDGSATVAEISQRDLQYYKACEASMNGVPLDRAVKAYLETNPAEVEKIRLAELVEEFIKRNTADPHLSLAQKSTMRHHLGKFAKAVNRPLTLITSHDVDNYLDNPEYAPRTRHNHRSSIIVLFNYARRKGYLPEDKKHAAEKSEEIRFKRPEVEIYSPAQANALLSLADPCLTPFLAIGLFAGVRSAELQRLSWEDVDWTGGVIRLDKNITKTNQSRLVPMLPNLTAWLLPYKGLKGNIMKSQKATNTYKIIGPWLKSAENPALPSRWIDNGMRHSFASYYLAFTQNAAQAALACGHSVSMLLGTYKTVSLNGASLTKEVGQSYFEIGPVRAENVIAIKSNGKTK